MILYILIFFIIVVLASGAKSKKKQQTYFTGCMVFLALFVGFADMLGGYDRYIYAELFDGTADDMRDGVRLWETSVFSLYGNEYGYCIWNYVVGLVTRNRYIFIMLTTFFIYFLFWRGIRKQTENPMFALIIFMALTFFFTFTYLRQMMAAAIAWQAIPYIEKKNLKMFALWMFIAFSFHHSAIDFVPVYFIPFRKFKLRQVDTVMAVCFILGMSGIADGLFDAYSSAVEERGNAIDTETGFRIAYFIEAMFFYYFIRKYYAFLGNDNQSLIGLNLSIVFCCILLVFIKSENGGRLTWFFMIGLYNLMATIFSGKKKLSNPGFIIVVCFFLFFRILDAWSFQLYPYKTFFTSGVRDYDPIADKYEYDHKYDSDKFYR